MAFNSVKLERRPWTQEEKEEALKSCGYRCSCCGTKLNMKTLTMEHVVPISKGGENVSNNLIALCKSCNSAKGNKFFWPRGYYQALNNGYKLKEIADYTENWVHENISMDYFAEYPMISEMISMQIKPKNMKYNFKNGTYIPSLIYDIEEVNSKNAYSILKEAGVSVNQITKNNLCEKDRQFSLVVGRVRSTQKVSSIYTIQVINDHEEYNYMVISEVYKSSNTVTKLIPAGLITSLADQWVFYKCPNVVIRFLEEKSYNEIYQGLHTNNFCANIPIGYSVNYYEQFWFPYHDIKSIYGKNQLFLHFADHDEFASMESAKDMMRNKFKEEQKK